MINLPVNRWSIAWRVRIVEWRPFARGGCVQLASIFAGVVRIRLLHIMALRHATSRTIITISTAHLAREEDQFVLKTS